MKAGRDENRRGITKNSECSATISLNVKLSIVLTKKKNLFVKVP